MPLYGFDCKKCLRREEILRPVSRMPKTRKCQSCGYAMKRTVGSPPAHFKGSGFYDTDYKVPREDKIKKEMAKAGMEYNG